MKNFLIVGIGVVLAFISCSVWAKENELQFTLVGVQGQAFANAYGILKNQQALLIYPLSPAEIQRFATTAPNEIEKAIQPYGFFKPLIRTTVDKKEQVWTTHFIVHPGPQMLVRHLDFEIMGPGKSDSFFVKLVQNFPIKMNEPLNIDRYNEAKDTLFKIASARGYFDAKITVSRVIIDLNTYQAHIIIHFFTGDRYRFGATTFNKTPFSERFLNRFLTYHAGEYYDYAKLQKAQQYFVTSNYFKQTVVTPDLEEKKANTVPIKIHLIAQKKEQVTYGLGYGSDTGVRATFGLNLRRTNQEGHYMNFLGQISSSGNHVISTNYYIPGKNPALNQYVISAGIGHIDINNPGNIAISTNEKISVSYSTYLGDIQQIVALTYLNERYILSQFNLPYINTNVVYPSIIWQFIHRDRKFQPSNGFSAYAILSAAPGLTDVTFFQSRLRLRGLWTPFSNTRILARLELGHTSINQLTQLPLSLQLLAGGVNSIRGFNFDSIGPGYNLAVGSIEVQQRLKGNFYLGVFVDSGTVFQGQVYTGVGPALVMVSPVGSFEVSLARSINPNQKGLHFDFSMGQDL